ncbi:MAG: transporter substrate-binding domain-containing protein [Bradyrhizobium sp.]
MNLSIITKSLALGLLATAGLIQSARADEMATIKDRGALVVGVKADYPPFGYRAPNGDIIGLGPTLAADVAKKLGVKVQYVPVTASNRMQFLQQGKIDLLIATMNVTPEREKLVWFVTPYYYASGYNIMLSKKLKVGDWGNLKGQSVCGIQGSYYNKDVQEQFGIHVVAFTGTSEALTALKQGRCIGFIYDNTAIQGKLLDPDWSAFGMPLTTRDAKPWGMATRLGDKAFHSFMDQMSADWAKSGEILRLETKFGIKQHSDYAAKMHAKYSGK